MYSLYIFDLDGTLLNTLQDLASSVNHALRTAQLPERTTEEVRMMVGNGVEKLIQRAVPDISSEETTGKVLATFRQHYMLHGEDTTLPYPGIPELLARLHDKGKEVAVVSNKFDAATKLLCERFFPGLIDIAVGENEKEGIKKKPAPDTVISVMKQMNRTEADCIYIGDSDVDVMTARNAGIDCIAVLWGFRDKDFLTASGATRFAQSPSDIF